MVEFEALNSKSAIIRMISIHQYIGIDANIRIHTNDTNLSNLVYWTFEFKL